MRYLINNKTKQIIELAPGVDAVEVQSAQAQPDEWKYVCDERSVPDDTNGRRYDEEYRRFYKDLGIFKE